MKRYAVMVKECHLVVGGNSKMKAPETANDSAPCIIIQFSISYFIPPLASNGQPHEFIRSRVGLLCKESIWSFNAEHKSSMLLFDAEMPGASAFFDLSACWQRQSQSEG